MAQITYGEFSWERMTAAIRRVEESLGRAISILDATEVPYAVIGGVAVQRWVATVDPSAVRNTPNVDILIGRGHQTRAAAALCQAGFIEHVHRGRVCYADRSPPSHRAAVRFLYSNERVRPDDLFSTPDVQESLLLDGMRVVALRSLVIMKLTAFRIVDRVHLRDMTDVELLDRTWLSRLPAELCDRLQLVLDTPDD
jgi:hypothetical protein